jgi:hypothetical protein
LFILASGFLHAKKYYDMEPPTLLPLRRKACCEFLSPLNIHHSRPGLNTRILRPIASTITITLPTTTRFRVKTDVIIEAETHPRTSSSRPTAETISENNTSKYPVIVEMSKLSFQLQDCVMLHIIRLSSMFYVARLGSRIIRNTRLHISQF